MNFKEILELDFISIGNFHLSLIQIIIAIVIISLTRLLLNIFRKLIAKYFERKRIDSGRQFAFLAFVKYIIYVIATMLVFEVIGIKFSVIWGGAAALLVGFGLGLQQTFNDLISGLILLVEGTVDVNNIIDVDGTVGRVIDIGIRTTKIVTRNEITLLIPNSKIIGDGAVNWSHNRKPIRYNISVGVAYASDIKLVTDLLLTAVKVHPSVLSNPKPSVQFTDFGNSSLDFNLFFYSREFMRVEFVKSDIRYRILELFREHKIEIPFPQNDLWLRNAK